MAETHLSPHDLPSLSTGALSVSDARAALREILRDRSVRTGHFTLASGKHSDLYIDARATTLHAQGSLLIARLLARSLQQDIVGVGGPVTGADPITGALVAISGMAGRPLSGFMVRKAAKGHGTGHVVEGRGNLPDGSKVCMLEDTVTTGGSLLRAIQLARADGLDVTQCICIVDRDEGGAQRISEAGLRLEALFTRHDLIDPPSDTPEP